jgi:hypothetical protein
LGHLSNVTTVIYFSALIAGGGMTFFEVWRYFSG